jgi:Xaa-Pro aminopeptidase
MLHERGHDLPHFVPQKVFADREKRIKNYLEENDFEALIVTTPDNFYMVTGFHLDVAPWERPVAAVIPADGEPFLIMNELSTNHLKFAEERKTLYIKDYEIYVEHPRAYPRTYTVEQWGRLLAEKLRSRGIDGGFFAVEGGGPAPLKSEMENVAFVDVSGYLRDLRMVKYPEELEIFRLCAEITDYAQDRYMELVKPGLTVQAFDFEIAKIMSEEAARRFPEDRWEGRVRSSSGKYSAAPHGSGAYVAEQFQEGDGVVNIIIGRLNGLVVESERTLFVGDPRSEIQVRAYEAATAANEAAAAEMYAGNTVANADAAAQLVIEKAGFGENINHRTGHGIGIAGHEFPEDMPFLYRPFWENEVYSSEPGIYLYDIGGFRQDDTVIVGKDKPEVITKRSKKLEDQIAKNF